MNIQQLKYFIEIADTNNLSAAARNLFVTQPTLSLALKKMESELRSSLFTHSPQPFQLTKTGKHLYEQGQVIVQQFDQLITDIHVMSDQEKTMKKKLRIGLPTLFSMQFMKEISEFLGTHPHVDLAITQDGSPHLQAMLEKDELDIGLLSFPNLAPEKISIELLETSTKGYHVYVVVPEDSPLAQRDELSFNDLEGQRFSSLTTNYMLGRLLFDRAREIGFEPNVVLFNNDLQVLLHSLVENESICLLPIEYQNVSKSDGLKWIPLKDKQHFFPIGIALRKDASLSKDMKAFIEMIKRN